MRRARTRPLLRARCPAGRSRRVPQRARVARSHAVSGGFRTAGPTDMWRRRNARPLAGVRGCVREPPRARIGASIDSECGHDVRPGRVCCGMSRGRIRRDDRYALKLIVTRADVHRWTTRSAVDGPARATPEPPEQTGEKLSSNTQAVPAPKAATRSGRGVESPDSIRAASFCTGTVLAPFSTIYAVGKGGYDSWISALFGLPDVVQPSCS